jgi:aryl-alcohol dehydrogenase-like predicted oxidoreductase
MAQLALGTVQFGIAYGVAGRGAPVPEDEIRGILAAASRSGINMLDTAPGYGDIEQRLGELAGDHSFLFVSKVPAVCAGANADKVAQFVRESVQRTRERLGPGLRTLLFHRPEDLLEKFGDVAWRAARDAAGPQVRIGASCYSPETATAIRGRFPIEVTQLPGNALDQRLAEPRAVTGLEGLEIHLRSVFLQGLLLMPFEVAVERVPKAASALAAWHLWCRDAGIAPLLASLGVVKALPGVDYCIVGVDSVSQLEEIVGAWGRAQPLHLETIASRDQDVLDPRRWAS